MENLRKPNHNRQSNRCQLVNNMDRNDYMSEKVYHQTQDGTLKAEKVLRIGLYKAVGILATAVLGSAGVAVWGTITIANTIPFRVSAIEKDVMEIKEGYQTKEISNLKWATNDAAHIMLEKKLDVIEVKIDYIRNLIK